MGIARTDAVDWVLRSSKALIAATSSAICFSKGLSMAHPNRYGIGSYLRRLGGRGGQFWPYFMPVVGPKVLAGYLATGRALDCWSFVRRDSPRLEPMLNVLSNGLPADSSSHLCRASVENFEGLFEACLSLHFMHLLQISLQYMRKLYCLQLVQNNLL